MEKIDSAPRFSMTSGKFLFLVENLSQQTRGQTFPTMSIAGTHKATQGMLDIDTLSKSQPFLEHPHALISLKSYSAYAKKIVEVAMGNQHTIEVSNTNLLVACGLSGSAASSISPSAAPRYVNLV